MQSAYSMVKAGAAIGLALLLFSGCSTVNHKVGSAFNLDTDLKLEITSSKDINPDEQGKPSPVFIRLYELTGAQAFEKASFIDLYERDEEILGDTFIAKQELKHIVPDQVRSERFVLSKGTRYVALFAEFYRYSDAKAKVVFEVTESNLVRNVVKINVTDNSVTLVEK